MLLKKVLESAQSNPYIHYLTMCPLNTYHHLIQISLSLNTIAIPNTLCEALSKEEWRNAMREETDALKKIDLEDCQKTEGKEYCRLQVGFFLEIQSR